MKTLCPLWFERSCTSRKITKKFIILDIRATDNRGNYYDIEMQVRKYEAYPKRTLFYVSKMYADQLKSGDDYGLLVPVIGIHFLDYTLFPGTDDFHFHFYMRDIRYPALVLTDDLSVHIFELSEADKAGIAKTGDMTEWLRFFNHAHEEVNPSMREHYKNPAVHKAFDLLEKLSADEVTRRRAEMREKALKDEVTMLADARREGERLATLRTAKNLLTANILSVEQIAEATGLTTDEVRKLRD